MGVLLATLLSERGRRGGGGWIFLILFVKDYNVHGSYDSKRVFNIFCKNNLELAGDKRRTVMRPPQVF